MEEIKDEKKRTKLSCRKGWKQAILTSLFFMANIMALACSAAFPTIGSRITLIKASGMFNDSEAPCYNILKMHSSKRRKCIDEK
jgi:hypothetical protein